MLALVSILKLIAEIALLALLGQGLLALLAGRQRESNLFYQVFQIITRPVLRLARVLSPRIVLDRHMPIVAFLIMAFVWIAATATKISICIEIGRELCK